MDQRQQVEFADIMRSKPQVALEHIAQKEAQGVRLNYTLALIGEPNVSPIPTVIKFIDW
jgi:hypothetical protein